MACTYVINEISSRIDMFRIIFSCWIFSAIVGATPKYDVPTGALEDVCEHNLSDCHIKLMHRRCVQLCIHIIDMPQDNVPNASFSYLKAPTHSSMGSQIRAFLDTHTLTLSLLLNLGTQVHIYIYTWKVAQCGLQTVKCRSTCTHYKRHGLVDVECERIFLFSGFEERVFHIQAS